MFSRFCSLEATLAYRYLYTKKKDGLLSFITIVSIIGIALGIITLIVVLSVMNGFQKDIRAKLYNISAHLELGYNLEYLAQHPHSDWHTLKKLISKNKHVLGAAPFSREQILLANGGDIRGAQVLAVLPKQEQAIINKKELDLTSLSRLKAGQFGIVLGQGLMNDLRLKVGDKVTVLSPEADSSPAGIMPRLKQFKVVGRIYSDIPDINQGYAYMHLEDARILFRNDEKLTGLRVKVDQPEDIARISQQIFKETQGNIWINNWSSNNRVYFQAVALEKKIMFILMVLISMVACFNLISSLVMTVNNKKSAIAILRTLGMPPANIMKIFILQGTLIGLVATILGLVLGITLTLNLTNLVSWYEHWSKTTLISPQVYFLSKIPTDIQATDLLIITLISLSLSFLATLYPSYRAAKTNPVEALRYE